MKCTGVWSMIRPNACLPPAPRYERAISLWGMSKTFGLPGLRIGWLALQDQDLRQRLLQFKDYTTICNSGPGELLSQIALAQAETLIARKFRHYRAKPGSYSNTHKPLVRMFSLGERPKPVRLPLPVSKRGIRLASVIHWCANVGVLLAPSTVFDFGDQARPLWFRAQEFW